MAQRRYKRLFKKDKGDLEESQGRSDYQLEMSAKHVPVFTHWFHRIWENDFCEIVEVIHNGKLARIVFDDINLHVINQICSTAKQDLHIKVRIV